MRLRLLIFLIFALIECSRAGDDDDVVVRVNQGPVRGRLMHAGEREVLAFRNIPYAKQPVGDLRLQMPKEPENWTSEHDLKGNAEIRCPQFSYSEHEDSLGDRLGQEDCLVLDIYVRKSERTKEYLPVLVYFHGGGFNKGSKEDYGPDFLLRFTNIILVVPNYRLGFLGFLNFNDKMVPGNLALWDQRAALQWTYYNIESFGGDSNRITIGGHEAGGVSVGLHVLAPVSHDYFQGAVSCSGTAFSPDLILNEQTSDVVHDVAEALRCPTESKEGVLRCVKNVPLENILEAQRTLKNVAFVPTVASEADHSFVPFPPKYLYLKGYQKNVNYLLGFADNEAAFDVSREFPKVLKFQHLDKMISHFLQSFFDSSSNLGMVVKAAKYHYMKGMVIPTFESIEPKIAKIMTDFLYESPVYQVIKAHSKRNENVFMYVFHDGERNIRDWHCGPGNRRCYGSEHFIFNKSTYGIPYESIPNVEEIIQTMTTTWGNFVKLGIPDVGRKWKKFGTMRHYAEISRNIVPKFNHNMEDTEFWCNLVLDLVSAQNFSQEQLASLPTADYPLVGTWGAAGLAILCGVVCIAVIGLVLITKRRTFTMSIVPVSSLNKDIRV